MEKCKKEYDYVHEKAIEKTMACLNDSGMSQAEAERELGISEKRLSNIKKGAVSKFYIEEIVLICNYFDIDIREFFGINDGSLERLLEAIRDLKIPDMTQKGIERIGNDSESYLIKKGFAGILSYDEIFGGLIGIIKFLLPFIFDGSGPEKVCSFAEYRKIISRYPESRKRIRVARGLLIFLKIFTSTGSKVALSNGTRIDVDEDVE